MNQILYTNNTKKKGGPLQINTVLRIFAILCIVFGVILVGQAVFAMFTKEETSQSVPLVEITQENSELLVSVKHDKIIDRIVYSYNENREIVLQGKGRMELQETITLPAGINNLTLKVTDIEGKTISYNQVYEVAQGDVISPEIELLVESSKLKIVVKDETELKELQLTIEGLEIEEKIDILKGENTLTIIAVDKSGNEETKEQIFKGVKKPNIDLLVNGNELIVKATDEEGIQKVELTLNGVYYSTDANNTGEPLNSKQVEFKLPLTNGENKITIKAYNVSGLVEEQSGVATI